MERSGENAGREPLDRPPLANGEAYASDIPFSKGRGPEDPWWSLQSVTGRIGPQVREIRERVADLTPAQLGRDRRVVLEATMLPNFLAASHYPGALFDATGLTPVGSRPTKGTRLRPAGEDELDQPAKTFLLSADERALERLDRLYGGEVVPQDALRLDVLKFTDFSLEGRDQVLHMGTGELPPALGDKFVFEAILHPQLVGPGEPDPAAAQRVREDFASYIEVLGGSVSSDYVRQEGGMWHFPVLLPADPTVVAEAAAFAQLRVLRPMPRLRPEPAVGEVLWQMKSVPAELPRDGRRVAVFDGGVDLSVPGLENWVTEHDRTGQPYVESHREHGTAVTSAALFGPLVLGESVLPPHTGVDHFRVWPLPDGVEIDAELPWVLRQIEDVISSGAYKIAVITLAPALTVEDSEPHLWTAVLDRLALDHDVLFVVAAGNNGELEAGLDRILVPADLLNGLSVGSCSASEGLAVRDPYSCVGPGRPGAMTAPTGVQFGGNLDSAGFGALIPGGDVAAHEGTSLAAPVVARACAELDALLDGKASANLLRTMAVHCAERPLRNDADQTGSTPRDVGYGRFPSTYRPHLEHKSNEVTVLYEGAVQRKQRIALDIPIPDEVFRAAPTRHFNFRWTLGFFAPVEPSNPVDYSAAGIQVVFRPHARRFPLINEKGETVGKLDLDVDTADFIKYVTEVNKWRVGEFPVSTAQTGVAPEVVQRQHHGKWEGVVRMDRRMQGKSLLQPRLDFHMLTREGGDLQSDADELRYSLVVNVMGPPDIDLYEQTVAHATLLTPLTVSVPVLVST